MVSGAVSDREQILAAVTRWEQAQAELAKLSFTTLTAPEVVAVQNRLEQGYRSQPAVDHKLIHQLISQSTPTELGANSWPKVLSDALHISKGEAKRRIKQAELLGPRTAMTGETCRRSCRMWPPRRRAGRSGPNICKTIEKLLQRSARRTSTARPATRPRPTWPVSRPGWGRRNSVQAADRLALLLNQDGDLPDDAERARRRYLTIDKQGVDGMSRFHGLLDPEARATLDAVFAKLAAPGMCNPDDEAPCVDGEPERRSGTG